MSDRGKALTAYDRGQPQKVMGVEPTAAQH